MDNQGMGSQSEPFFDLLQPTTPPIIHSSASSSNYSQNGPRRMESSSGGEFDFKNDDVLPNFDFQPLHSNGHNSGSGSRIEDVPISGSKIRQTSPPPANYSTYEPQICRPRDPPVTYEKYESTRPRHEFDKDAYDSATVAAVERTMKKYADNLLRVLEGMSGRLSQLEATTQRLEQSFEKIKASSANNHGEVDGKMRMLENIVREVQRGVQVLRDKQEITEAAFQLKLQQEKADASAGKPHTHTEGQVPPVASAPQHPAISQQVQPQAPQQPLPQGEPTLHHQSSMPVVQHQPQPPQQVSHPVQQQMTPYYPPQNPMQQPPQGPMQQLQQGPMQQPPQGPMPQPPQGPMPQPPQGPMPQPPQGPMPQPPQSPMQQPQQSSMPQIPQAPPMQHQHQYGHQPEAPPYPPAPHPQGAPMHHQASQSQAPPVPAPPAPPMNYGLEMPPYMPSNYGPPQQPQRLQPSHQQQQHGPPGQIYESSMGRTGSGQLALPPPPYAGSQQVPAYESQAIMASGYGGPGYRVPPSSGGYPHLPTAQPVQQSLPGGSRPPSRSGVDDIIDKVAAMGFPREQVRGTVQRLTENGQSVDMNVVLDKLMNGGGAENPKGWFGR